MHRAGQAVLDGVHFVEHRVFVGPAYNREDRSEHFFARETRIRSDIAEDRRVREEPAGQRAVFRDVAAEKSFAPSS